MYKCLCCKKECESYRQKTNKYCSQTCQMEYQTKQRITAWLKEGKDWSNSIPGWVKAPYGYLAQTHGYKCGVCGISKHNNQPLVLECDHINGDHKNNKPNNLRLICPNCHSQTDTYKNRNYGNGRMKRRKVITQ